MTRMFSRGFLAAGAIGVIASAGPVWAQTRTTHDGYPYGPHMMEWGGGFGMVLGPIVMILTLAVVIAVAVLLVRWLGGPWSGSASSDAGRRALDILKERYARGEIDKDEFEARRRVLGE